MLIVLSTLNGDHSQKQSRLISFTIYVATQADDIRERAKLKLFQLKNENTEQDRRV